MKRGPLLFHHLASFSTVMFRVPFTMWGHSHWIWVLGCAHFGRPLFCFHMSNFIYLYLLSQLCPERHAEREEVIYLGYQVLRIQTRDHLTCVAGIRAPLLVISLLFLSRPCILNALIWFVFSCLESIRLQMVLSMQPQMETAPTEPTSTEDLWTDLWGWNPDYESSTTPPTSRSS